MAEAHLDSQRLRINCPHGYAAARAGNHTAAGWTGPWVPTSGPSAAARGRWSMARRAPAKQPACLCVSEPTVYGPRVGNSRGRRWRSLSAVDTFSVLLFLVDGLRFGGLIIRGTVVQVTPPQRSCVVFRVRARRLTVALDGLGAITVCNTCSAVEGLTEPLDTLLPRTPPSPTRRPRQRWLQILLAALFILAAFGAFAGWFLSNYEALRANLGPTLLDSAARSFGQIAPPDGAPPFAPVDVEYRHGESFSYGFTLINDGPIDLWIEEVSRLGRSPPLDVLSVRMGRINDFSTRTTQPLRPFSLPAHASRFILIEGRFTGCTLGPGIGTAVNRFAVPVTFRMFWITRHAFLPLPYSLRITGNGGCPNT
jgi:hypothetical protein